MIKQILFVGVIFFSGDTIAQPESFTFTTPFGDTEEYRLEFADEFDGNSLNTDKWKAITGVPRDPNAEHQKHYFQPQNVEVSDGTCKLWAKREKLPNQDFWIWIVDGMKKFNTDFEFTSAEINTAPEYGFGMYEIRCKLPKAKGMWPAFWLFNAPEDKYDELDVFEYWNQKNVFGKVKERRLSKRHHMSVHYNGRMSKVAYWGDDMSDDFHTFTLYWDLSTIQWYVDGELMRIQYRYKGMNKKNHDYQEFEAKKKSKGKELEENVFPQNENLMIIADLAVQKGERAPDEDTEMPQALEIDYIRHYKKVK